jgi:hypothetical protein
MAGIVREHTRRGTSAVEADTKQRLVETEEFMCTVVTVTFRVCILVRL